MIYEKVIRDPDSFDFSIQDLGECRFDSPVRGRIFVADDEKISFASQVGDIRKILDTAKSFPAFQKAGPRKRIFHDPAKCRAAVVTCGGLCPGLNNVIKGLVSALHFEYGVREILGIRYGYQGLGSSFPHPPLSLSPALVDDIHREGGTLLGSSRGNRPVGEMVDTLERLGIDLLFCIGGDGTFRGGKAIADEVARRGRSIGVIGLPKTIDNDLSFVEKSFGFETAVHTAFEIITSAHNEARGAVDGIGIVKLMGRDSGFIAGAATLANSVVNFCLVPEVEFALKGECGLFKALERKLDEARHAVIVVAEGAGQYLFRGAPQVKDASGNVLKNDIGILLRDEIGKHFREAGRGITIKYFDPSYHIRSVTAISSDAIFCSLLAEHAVHAAMGGKTGAAIGYWNNYFTHVPFALVTNERRKVDLESAFWNGVLSATRQNDYFLADPTRSSKKEGECT